MNKLIVITGPTAVGKTKLAALFASRNAGEIISADSRQVYKSMDIGTGKDIEDYVVDGVQIPYHLIDILEAGDKYFINQYYKDYVSVLKNIQERNKLPILCGGSGLYIETALEGNPWSAIPINEHLRFDLEQLSDVELLKRVEAIPQNILKNIDISTTKRMKRGVEIAEYLKFNSLPSRELPEVVVSIFALELDRELIKQRIYDRLIARLQQGMIEEVEELMKRGVSAADLKYYGLEYRWITSYLLGEVTRAEMIEGLNIGIRQFAKRQMTWFRRMEKKGYCINWLDASKPTIELVEEIENIMGIT